jgi:hypothetical protein
MYVAQIGIAPPTFVFFTNIATTFHFSYERFLVNKIREQFGFEGTPIRVQVRRRAKSVPGGHAKKLAEQRAVVKTAKARAEKARPGRKSTRK